MSMIEKELILRDLQNTLHNTDNEQVKLVIGNVIADVLSGKFDIRIWD
jgi:hypothetical protein